MAAVTIFSYKGYFGICELVEDGTYFGYVLLNIRGTFLGNTLEEAEQEFQLTVEDILDWGKEDNFAVFGCGIYIKDEHSVALCEYGMMQQ